MKLRLPDTLLTPAMFEETMVFFPIRQGSSTHDIAYAFHVLGQPVSAIAAKYACSRQNVVRVLNRFIEAHAHAVAVRQHVADHVRAVAAPGASKKTSAKKTSAKKISAK